MDLLMPQKALDVGEQNLEKTVQPIPFYPDTGLVRKKEKDK